MKPFKNNIVDRTYIQHLLTKNTILVQSNNGVIGKLISVEIDSGICYLEDKNNNNKSTILINEIGLI